MLSPLQSFMLELADKPQTLPIDIGGRYEGQVFTIRGLSLEEVNELRKKAVLVNSAGVEQVNEAELVLQVVIAGCVEPSFKSEEFVRSAGVTTPSQLLNRIFVAGEVAKLSNEILKASGLRGDINKAISEAKNS